MDSYVPEDERGLNRFLDQIEAEGTDDHRQAQWRKSIQLYNTGQADRVKRGQRYNFRANLLGPTVRRKGALLAETKPRLDVKPTVASLYETARQLKHVMNAGWEAHGVQQSISDICELYLQVLDAGFLEIGWDRYADYGAGSIAVNAIDPRTTILDPAVVRARDFDRAQYFRVKSIHPLHVIADLYPAIADRLKSTRKIMPQETDESRGPGISAAIRARAGRLFRTGEAGTKSDSPVPRVEIDTYWFQDPRTDSDGAPLYPGGRCVVRATPNVICLTKELSPEVLREQTRNPYYDGLWPFEMLDNVPDIDSPWGREELAALRFIQQTFERIGDTAVEVMLVNAPPFVTAPKHTLEQATIDELRRMKHIVLEYTAGRGQVHRQPSPIPSQLYFQLMQMCQGLIEFLTGLQDAGGGVAPGRGRVELRSSSLLEGLQNAQQVLVRAQARRLEAMLQRAGQKWVSRIFQFMTVDQVMAFSNEQQRIQSYNFERVKLTAEIFDLALKQLRAEHERKARQEREDAEEGVIPITTAMPPPDGLDSDQQLAAIKGAWRQLRFYIEPYSSLSTSRVARMQMLEHFAQQMWMPGSKVVEEAGFENAQELRQQAVAEAAAAQAMGLPPPGAQQQPKGKGKQAAGGKR